MTKATRSFLIISFLTLLFSIGVVTSLRRNSLGLLTEQDHSSAQTLPCSANVLSTIGRISLNDPTTPSINCLLSGEKMYANEDRFTFFGSPESLQAKQLAFIKTDNISLKANHQLSWTVEITKGADLYIFYRKIPGQTAPDWLNTYTRITSDSYANLLPFMLRKNDQGLIGVYDIYKKTIPVANTIALGPAFSSTGEAYSMYIVGVSPLVSSTTPPATSSPTPTFSTGPLPSGQAKQGIWISPEEIARLPITGTAWNNLKARADSPIGSANLADQNSQHDQSTLAVALVAARTGDPAYRAKAVAAILSAINTDANHDADCTFSPNKARSLALSRNLPSYIIAADVINLRDGTDGGNGTRWAQYVNFIRSKKNCRNNGSVPEYNLSESHDNGSSNGDALAGGARIAAALYLGDKAEVEKAWQTYQRYSGDLTKCPTCNPNFNAAGISWSYTTDASKQVAVNPAGSTKNGHRVDGAIINDQGRGGGFSWPPGYTQYPWEGMQGYILQAELLSRAGYPSYFVQNNAPLRTLDYQYYLSQQFGAQWMNNEPWVTWVINKAYGQHYPVLPTNGGGKNMSWTDWTHQL